jgi:hypothetical protein
MTESVASPQPVFPSPALEDALFRAVQEMDREACTRSRKGAPTGLNYYGAYFRPNLVRPPSETSWTRRLEQLLPLYGFPTRREFPYSHSDERCDSLIMLEDGSNFWLESKGAWKKYWEDQGKKGVIVYRPGALFLIK